MERMNIEISLLPQETTAEKTAHGWVDTRSSVGGVGLSTIKRTARIDSRRWIVEFAVVVIIAGMLVVLFGLRSKLKQDLDKAP